jgi:hypothetical protein
LVIDRLLKPRKPDYRIPGGPATPSPHQRKHGDTHLDGHALAFYGWGVRGGFPMNELGAYRAWKDRMLQRPAVRKILDSEQNVLVKPA